MRTQRGLFLLATLASGVMGVVLLAGFFWPSGIRQDFLNLGSAERYAPGSGYVFRDLVPYTDERWGVTTLMFDAGFDTPAFGTVSIALARHEDGSFSAFLARDPRNGCLLAWREDLPSFEGGHWRDPCHSSTYDAHGVRVFGPTPKDMDAFRVSVNGAGEVIVDLRTLIEGEQRLAMPADLPPDAWPTATPVAP